MPLKNAKRLWLLAVLVLSLTGCATNSTPSPPPLPGQIPPPPPELMEAPLSDGYSESVRQLLLKWRLELTSWQRNS
jgi:hypothetical protein